MIGVPSASNLVSYNISKGLDFVLDDRKKDFESQLRDNKDKLY
ncbi:hypothetical protein [Ascidiimonas sp. W6]